MPRLKSLGFSGIAYKLKLMEGNGIIAMKLDSIFLPGERYWVKDQGNRFFDQWVVVWLLMSDRSKKGGVGAIF